MCFIDINWWWSASKIVIDINAINVFYQFVAILASMKCIKHETGGHYLMGFGICVSGVNVCGSRCICIIYYIGCFIGGAFAVGWERS